MSDENGTKPTGLHGKLAEVMAEVGRVPKRGRNEFHKYDYATEADIVDAVRGALSSRSVSLVPSVRQVIRDGTLTTALMAFQFTDGETGETATYEWAGTGDDKGDKGLYKAMTGALKYFLLKTFLLPTGDDPEADTETDKRAAGMANSRGRGKAPSGPSCLRCSAPPIPGSGLCVTCTRLAAERKADDVARAAKAAQASGSASTTENPPPATTPEDAAAKHGWEKPLGTMLEERNTAFGRMNLHGFNLGKDAKSRDERLKLYARALGREKVTEAEAKTLTAQDWRLIADLVKRENEPPVENDAPMGVVTE